MKHFSLAAAPRGAVVACLILISTNSVFAQFVTQTAQDIWILPPLVCANGEQCEIRLSLEGDLFIYSTSTATLYTSRQGETAYSSYNLQPYVRWITGGFTEFVPFSDDNVVVFYGSADRTLSRLNLTTGEMTRMSQTDEHRRLLACNGYIGRGGSHHHISRLATGSQLLFCSLSDDATTILVSVVDVVTQTTLQTYDFGLPWLGEGNPPSWNMLLGGQDGNIYIDVADVDPRMVWQQLAGSVPALPDWGWRLFRYEVNSGTWSVRNIIPEQMGSDNYPPSSGSALSRVGAVLPNGDIVHQYEWSQIPSNARIVEISLYRPNDFQLIDRISSQETGRPASFVGVSAEGLVLLQAGTTLSDLFVEQLDLLHLFPRPRLLSHYPIRPRQPIRLHLPRSPLIVREAQETR